MKTIKNFTILMLVTIHMVLLTGCSNGVIINIPESELTKDTNKSYLIINSLSNSFGKKYDIDVVYFDKNNLDTKLIAVLTDGERTIFQLEEGEHYLFTKYLSFENMTMIKTIKNKKYYMNLKIVPGRGAIPILYEKDRINLKQSLLNTYCSQYILDQYLFIENSTIDNNKEQFFIPTNNKNINEYISPTDLYIKCNNGKIVEVKDNYLVYDLKELNNLTLIKPSPSEISNFNEKKATFTKDIQTYNKIWEVKFKNVKLSESPFLKILDLPNINYYKRFENVIIRSLKHEIPTSGFNNFDHQLKSKVSDLSDKDNILYVEYKFDKYDDGSMLSRYLELIPGTQPNNDGVIDIIVTFKNSNNNIISSIKISSIESGGIFGGINTLNYDVINIINNYIRRNFITTKVK